MDIIDEINNNDYSWKAEFNKNFKGLSFILLNEILGSKKKFIKTTQTHNHEINMKPIKTSNKDKCNNIKKDKDTKEIDPKNYNLIQKLKTLMRILTF